ncbi:MAG: CopG family transcriptional regulator [Phycisphaerales bacterium]|jgi:predicted transcriptional regulator|nr:CopG family transcriptional regulator [Phycisphaerales bacterium]MBT7171002.1 CopG family transcriptional regulator [Phycisphaerales bacterium]
MSKTVTLRLKEETYEKFRDMAAEDNRPLSNFIETAALRFIQEQEHADEFEMAEIRENVGLNRSLTKGLRDAKAKRGRFV